MALTTLIHEGFYMSEKIIKVNADGTSLVSTRGYRRIVGYPGGRPLVEFVSKSNAKRCVEIYNGCFPDSSQWAEAITYGEFYRRHVSGEKPHPTQAPKMTPASSKPRKKRSRKLKIARVA